MKSKDDDKKDPDHEWDDAEQLLAAAEASRERFHDFHDMAKVADQLGAFA